MAHLSPEEVKMSRMGMTEHHRTKLRDYRLPLVRNLIPSDEFLLFLRRDDILTSEMYQTVDSKPIRVDKVGCLLTILPTRTELAYYRFIQALLETKQIDLVRIIDDTHPLYRAFLIENS